MVYDIYFAHVYYLRQWNYNINIRYISYTYYKEYMYKWFKYNTWKMLENEEYYMKKILYITQIDYIA